MRENGGFSAVSWKCFSNMVLEDTRDHVRGPQRKLTKNLMENFVFLFKYAVVGSFMFGIRRRIIHVLFISFMKMLQQSQSYHDFYQGNFPGQSFLP